ncbi:B3 domain-containing protein Os03g0212300-like [Phragmites australis]|uniref:B3 domain-containing protein Os03g0212300-like n=1 Tax=Phragmites australis TaxID=29695 RepID=UPI002D76F9DC|nr:B3 domain-containing protein Os03g0212300-like [Phragmites australis]
MEQGMADLHLGEFEFFKILLPGMSKKKLRLPAKFAGELGEHRDSKLRLAGAGPLWDVDVVSSGDGVYLGRSWRQFASAHDLLEGHLLVLRYDGAGVSTVTVFDGSTCRKQYPHTAAKIFCPSPGSGSNSGGAGAGGGSPSIADPSHLAVTLRQCNLGTKQNQYLNVPVEFQDAHGYARRRRVLPRMGGRSWAVNRKRGKRVLGDRTEFKYGWHQFCVDNGLDLGDTCFFRVIREGSAGDGEEEDDHVLKVEVRKDGTFVA